MKMMVYISLVIVTINCLLLLMLNLISKKTFMDREKMSPFECGFDPKSSSRNSFSLHFFLIAIIFLIFDVEITLLLPLIMYLKIKNILLQMIISSLFIMILIIGLMHEWKQGALNWTS